MSSSRSAKPFRRLRHARRPVCAAAADDRRHMGYHFRFQGGGAEGRALCNTFTTAGIRHEHADARTAPLWETPTVDKKSDFLADRPKEGAAALKYQRYIHDYCRTIRSVDDQIGRVLDYLEENGLMDNTLIVYNLPIRDSCWANTVSTTSVSVRGVVPHAADHGVARAYPSRYVCGSWCRIRLCPDAARRRRRGGPDGNGRRLLQPLFRSGKARGWRTSLYYQYYDYPAVGSVRAHVRHPAPIVSS